MREIESQAFVAQQQIGLARTQMTSKQREQRLVKLTINEMATLPSDAVVYEGVGKMYVPANPFLAVLFIIDPSVRCLTDVVISCRFVSLPVDSLRQKLEGQTQTLEGEVDKLSQRLLYLETTHKNSREHIEQMLRTK